MDMRAFVCCLVVFTATVQCRGDESADAKEILGLENALNAAWLKHDTATIGAIIADDFQSWSFKGARRNKADLLRAVERSEESDTKVEDPLARDITDVVLGYPPGEPGAPVASPSAKPGTPTGK